MIYKRKMLLLTLITFLSLIIINPIIFAENNIQLTFKEKKYIISYNNPKTTIINSSKIINFSETEYRALLIGIKNYPGDIDLPYSINEILSFKNTLMEGGNWINSNIHILNSSEANKSAIFNEINWLSLNADENDVTIFYYVGHGSRNSTNEHLFVYDGLISDKELDQKLKDVKGQVIVILDSCYSGGFIKEVGKKDRVVLTACKKDEATYQVSDLNSGIFGYFLNISLARFTKSAEKTFLLTWIFSIYYSTKLSREYNEDYTIHPRIYDGTFGGVKIIENHTYNNSMLNEILNKSIEKNLFNIWKI